MGAAVATPRLLTRSRRLLASLLLPLVIVGLCLFQAQPADAARGGRMGGGSFRAPSMPRSGGSYRGGSYGGGYRGGGMGFPFLITEQAQQAVVLAEWAHLEGESGEASFCHSGRGATLGLQKSRGAAGAQQIGPR